MALTETNEKPYRDIQVEVMTLKEADINDDLYWSNSTVKERFETTTRLREYYHGREATTGRVQRICTVSKLL